MHPKKISDCIMKYKDYLCCQPGNIHDSFGFHKKKKKSNQLTEKRITSSMKRTFYFYKYTGNSNQLQLKISFFFATRQPKFCFDRVFMQVL